MTLWAHADDRLLIEGRVRITFHSEQLTRARVEGARDWDVRWTPMLGWECSCPLSPACVHLRAVQRVVERSSARTVMEVAG